MQPNSGGKGFAVVSKVAAYGAVFFTIVSAECYLVVVGGGLLVVD